MSYTRSLVTIAFIAMVTMLLGCSGGGNPIAPDKTPDSLDSVPIIGLTDTNDTFNAVGLMGAYEITLNPENLSAELVNKRVSSIGEDYIVSGIAFFTVAPCADCLQMTGLSLDSGNLLLSFVISHPFAPGNTSEDPSAKNRLDLDVFDLAAVLLPTGDPAPTATAYSLTGDGIYTGFCVDPDGYTCELAEVITDDNALPYFLVIDDCETVDPPVGTFNKFAMGDSAQFDVAFDMASGSLRFDMYLTMGYGASAKKPQRLAPKYYNPEFNRKAAWKVVVTPPQGELTPAIGNTWLDNDAAEMHDVTVDVYDWQIGATVATEEEFGDAAADEVFAASEPTSVTVEVPGMSVTLPEATVPDNPLATGEPGDPWIFSVTMANANLLPAGEYLGLVKVTDGRPVLAPLDGRDFLIDTEDGIVLENYEMPEYATYQTFPATVVIGCGPITGQVDVPTCPITGVANGQTLDFTVSATSANGGGNVVLYEVDFDYDGTTFTVDDTSVTGVFTGVGPFTVPDPCDTNIPLDFTVAFRGTDECTPPNNTVFTTCLVTVDTCLEPVGDVTITVNRTGLSGYHYPINTTGPWTLDWSAAGGAAEYAIYVDTVPGDWTDPTWTVAELTDGLTLVDVTTALTFTVPGSHWLTPNPTPGYTYIVRSRSEIGNPATESSDSEIAFIIAEPWESYSTYDHTVGGWESLIQNNSTSNYQYMVIGSYRQYQNRNFRWSHQAVGVVGSLKELPTTVPNAHRHIDTSIDLYQFYPGGGIFFVTASEKPSPVYGITTWPFLEWVEAESSSPYYAYDLDGASYLTTAGVTGLPGSGNTSWRRLSPYGHVVGADFDATGEPTDPYIGIFFQVTSANCYCNIDETVLTIF